MSSWRGNDLVQRHLCFWRMRATRMLGEECVQRRIVLSLRGDAPVEVFIEIGGCYRIDRRDLFFARRELLADKVAAGVAESDQRRIDVGEIWRRRLVEQYRSEGDRKCKAFD